MADRGVPLRFAGLVVLVAALAVLAWLVGRPVLSGGSVVLEQAGWRGPVLAVAGTALLVAALVPRAVLAATGGLLFGPLAGTAYVLAGAALGATVGFVAGRWLGREFLLTRRHGPAVDRWVVRYGVIGVVTARLLPVAPFGLISYGYGTTGIRWRTFLLGTVLGAGPSTAVYASLGASALSPGTPGFVVSLLAALLLALGGAVGARWLTRHRSRLTGAVPLPRPASR